MAAPHRNRTSPGDPLHEKTRAKIQTTQLVKRLSHHVLGTKDEQGSLVDLSASQVAAAKVLIDKSLPSLQAVELTGQGGGPVQYSDLSDEQIDARMAELNGDSTD